MIKFLFVLTILIRTTSFAQMYQTKDPFAHTFSIVARDSATGDMAVAVQSHWFSVGTVVSWGESGVGVIATQSFVNKSFGPRGLQLLKSGLSSQEVLDSLLKTDPGKEVRQVAIMDTYGNVANFTGKNCVDFATQKKGRRYAVQSNMMLTKEVSNAMSIAYEANSTMPFAERVLSALKAAQAAGGDIRGSQSAALIIVSGRSSNEPWNDKLIDLRVDDHTNPIGELERLLKVHRAYEHMNTGDLFVEKNDMENAMKEYKAAEALFPLNLEMKYWHAITLANNKKIKEAAAILKTVYKKDKNWLELTKRLPKVGLLTVNENELKTLTTL